MRRYQSGPTPIHRMRLHACLTRTMLSLLSVLLVFSIACLFGQPPTTAYASGVPYCGKLNEEHAPTSPASHLDRSEGPVGTNVTVTVSGWHPGAHVTLNVDGRDPKTGDLYILMPTFAAGMVATDGTVTLGTLAAPSFFCWDGHTGVDAGYRLGEVGTTAFFVLTADDGEVSAPVAFQYLATPTLSLIGGAQMVAIGSSVAVTGSGWEPQEAIALTLTSTGVSTHRVSNGAAVHTTADSQGAFEVRYPIAADWPWYTNSKLVLNGSGPRYGDLQASADLYLVPAVPPTFRVDHTLVTPGMTFTVSGEHWDPGDTFTIKYCDSQLQDGAWTIGPNCGKDLNPVLGTVTVDANGRMRQQFRIPKNLPLGVVIVRVPNLPFGVNVPPIAMHVVDHLPTWDDTHPRVAAVRNKLLGSLPFTIPLALLLGALAVAGVYRRRAN